MSALEAILLAAVTLTAAWSGYAAALWGSEASLGIARAQATMTEATRLDLEARDDELLDALAFEAWFTADAAGETAAARQAADRFSAELREVFDAWRLAVQSGRPDVPAGPTDMPEYRSEDQAEAEQLRDEATAALAAARAADRTADQYVRTTVFLASVLFLVGISAHFPSRGVRLALLGLSLCLLGVSLGLITQLPGLPS